MSDKNKMTLISPFMKKAQSAVNRNLENFTDGLILPESSSSQPSCEPSSQPSCEPSSQPSCEPSSQPSCEPSSQHSCEHSSHNSWMTENQLKILNFIKSLSAGITSRKEIERATGINKATIGYALNAFVRAGIITKPVRFYRGTFRGFKFKIKDRS